MDQSTKLIQKLKQRDKELQLCYRKVGRAVTKGGAISPFKQNDTIHRINLIPTKFLNGCEIRLTSAFNLNFWGHVTNIKTSFSFKLKKRIDKQQLVKSNRKLL